MVLEGSARMRCVKPAGRSTRGRSTERLGVAGASASAMTTSSLLEGAPRGPMMTSTHSGRPGLTGLPTPIADPSAHSSEATTGGSRAGDSFNRREQGAGGLIHRGARVLVRNVSHEARNGGETPARTLAAPVVTITRRRKKRAQEVAVSGRTEQERPRATEQLLCVHAQKGQSARGVQPGKAPKPAQEPASVGPHDTWAHTIEQTGTPGPV